jgi:hypothetical protein
MMEIQIFHSETKVNNNGGDTPCPGLKIFKITKPHCAGFPTNIFII